MWIVQKKEGITINQQIKIDPELQELLPPLHRHEFDALEESILKDGLQDAVKVWIDPEDSKCYLVDGHNRYTIMDKYGKEIPQDKIAVLNADKYKTKDDIIFYMLQYQLGRRNLADAQRIDITDKYRPLIEKKAKENQSAGGGDKKSGLPNLGKPISKAEKIDTNAEMAKMVRMSKEKYRQGKIVLNSDNEEVKERYRRSEISTNKAYKEVADAGKDKTIDESDPLFKSKTVADYDKEITNVDAEIADLYEKKTKLIQARHEAFQADNQELRCEYTEEHNATWSRYSFYLVKGESKFDLFTYFDDFFLKDYTEFMEQIEQKLKYFTLDSKYSKLSKNEKAVIEAKLIEMRETVKQDRQNKKEAEEARKKVRDESFNQNLNQALGNLFRPQFNPVQKATLKKIYKAGAKALHSDVNGGNDEEMQFLNMLKELWGV